MASRRLEAGRSGTEVRVPSGKAPRLRDTETRREGPGTCDALEEGAVQICVNPCPIAVAGKAGGIRLC